MGDTRARPRCPPFDGETEPEAGRPDPGPAPTDTKRNRHGMPRIAAPRGPGRACPPQVGICPPATAKGLSGAPARILAAGKRRPHDGPRGPSHSIADTVEQPRRRPASPPEGTGPAAQENAWECPHHSLRVIWDSLPMDMATRQLAAARRRTNASRSPEGHPARQVSPPRSPGRVSKPDTANPKGIRGPLRGSSGHSRQCPTPHSLLSGRPEASLTRRPEPPSWAALC